VRHERGAIETKERDGIGGILTTPEELTLDTVNFWS
jgi:hypothetical protein